MKGNVNIRLTARRTSDPIRAPRDVLPPPPRVAASFGAPDHSLAVGVIDSIASTTPGGFVPPCQHRALFAKVAGWGAVATAAVIVLAMLGGAP